VRLARFKFDSPSAANTHTVETTMPPGLHGNLTQISSQPSRAGRDTSSEIFSCLMACFDPGGKREYSPAHRDRSPAYRQGVGDSAYLII